MKLSTSHKSIKVEGEHRIDVTTDKIIINPEIDHTLGIGIILIETEGTLTETTDQIIEVDQEMTIGKMIGKIITGKVTGEIAIDRTIEVTAIEITTGRTMDVIIIETRGIGKEVKVGTTTCVITGTIPGKDLSEVEIQGEIGVGKDSPDHDLEQNQKTEGIVIDQDQNQGLDPVQEYVQIRIDLGVISVEGMIILQGNVKIL